MNTKHWVSAPLQLEGDLVTLSHLETEHFPALEALAKDKRIWEYYAYDGTDSARFKSVLDGALDDLKKGSQFPFVIFSKASNKIIGSTRFMDIQQSHKKLEIGSTWLHPDYWGGAINLECKLLLLSFCFETLQAFRVQFKTDENNIRSRKAIEKIGGHFEGIFRNDMVRDNGTHRHSAYYSIIASEWTAKRNKLTALLESKLNLPGSGA
jgi:N-acetyltransferase